MATNKRRSYQPAEILLMLALTTAAAVGLNGAVTLRSVALCTAAAVFADYAGNLLLRNQNMLSDLTAVLTGVTAALMLPADCSPWLALFTGFTAILVGRLPFGDRERLPFVPAAVGAALACVLFPDAFFRYPPTAAGAVSSALLLRGGTNAAAETPGLIALFSGTLPGPAGCTPSLVLLCCFVYLVLRMPRRSLIPLGFLLAAAAYSLLDPPFPGAQLRTFLPAELTSGMLLFTAVFLLPFPHLRLRGGAMPLLYGMLGGLIYMLLRRFGVYEESAPFAVLLANAAAPLFEQKNGKKKAGTTGEGGQAHGTEN